MTYKKLLKSFDLGSFLVCSTRLDGVGNIYNMPSPLNSTIVRKIMIEDSRVVHTTSCPANAPSLSISSAMMALATATGVAKRAISAA